MSRVTETVNHQHKPNMAHHINQLMNHYSFEDLQENLKNITLISLYTLYQKLSKDEKKQLLNNLSSTQQIELTLLNTESNPVIELANVDQFLVVQKDCCVSEVKGKLLTRSEYNNHPIIVTNELNQYLGVIELHCLLSHADNTCVTGLISKITELHISEQQQNAATMIAHNDDSFAVLLDKQNGLVGLVSLTDILNKRAQHPENRPYLQTPVLSHVRQRIFWIIALAAVGLLSGIIIQSYDDAITALIILAFYMPMVADTGGNAGSQAATVIIRSIAIGELRLKNWFAILYKEMRIAIFIGIGLAFVSYAKIYFLSYGLELPEGLTIKEIAFAITLALFTQVLTATVIGASLPLLVKWCKQDPAVVASPAITTIVDITGLLIYFYITSALLF